MMETSRLPNGVTITTSDVVGKASVAVSVCLLNGVRHQGPKEDGLAHLMEHMLFSGSTAGNGSELARRFTAMGDEINAVTGRELTALTGVVAANDGDELIELFSEMLNCRDFADERVAVESRIVCQEMASRLVGEEDDLEEVIAREVWKGHSMARPILGDREVIGSARRRELRAYMDRNLVGKRIWVLAAGSLSHDSLVQAARGLTQLPQGEHVTTTAPAFHSGELCINEGNSLTRLAWVLPAVPIGDSLDPAVWNVRHLLSGHTQSRLYRRLRDELALSYGVNSQLAQYSDCGLLWIEAHCAAQLAPLCCRAVEQEMAAVLRSGFAADEIELTRQSLRAQWVINQDRLESQLEHLARQTIYAARDTGTAKLSPMQSAWDTNEALEWLRTAWQSRFVLEWRR